MTPLPGRRPGARLNYLPVPTTGHGTLTAYQTYGCSCEECRDAHRRYRANQRARRRGLPPPHPTPASLDPPRDRTWLDTAACLGVDPEVFYPVEGRDGASVYRDARAICGACPAREPCLTDALHSETFPFYGMRGGMTPSEREKLRKQMKEKTA